MTSDPAATTAIEHSVTVASDDIDANRHANNIAYLRWVQDAAVAHWLAAVDSELAPA